MPNSVFISGGCSRLLSVAPGPPNVSVMCRRVAVPSRPLARSSHQRAYFTPCDMYGTSSRAMPCSRCAAMTDTAVTSASAAPMTQRRTR